HLRRRADPAGVRGRHRHRPAGHRRLRDRGRFPHGAAGPHPRGGGPRGRRRRGARGGRGRRAPGHDGAVHPRAAGRHRRTGRGTSGRPARSAGRGEGRRAGGADSRRARRSGALSVAGADRSAEVLPGPRRAGLRWPGRAPCPRDGAPLSTHRLRRHRMARMSFAQLLVTQLRDLGVERIYGVVGDSLNPVVDAVRTTEGIEWVHVRNEEAGAFAAGAEARLTGKLAVCAGSCGPGNTHLLQGLVDAHRDGAPVLAIASHIPSDKIGTGFFQETQPEILFRECSHFCEMVNSGDHGATLLHIAVQTAIAKRGVSVLVLPGDVADQEADGPLTRDLACALGRVQPAAEPVGRRAELIDEADPVALLAGAGVRDAREDVLELAERIKSPIGHAVGGKEFRQYDNPLGVGMSGLLGYGACYEAMHEADLVILLGTDFPYTEFLPGPGGKNPPKVVQIDAEASRLGRRVPLDLALHGDVGLTLQAVMPLLTREKSARFLHRQLKAHHKALSGVVSAYTKN